MTCKDIRVSLFSLVAMAKDRYQAIVHPLSSYNWTPRLGHSHMIGVWCLSLLLASPQLFIFRLDHHPPYATKTCLAKFIGSDRTWELIYIAWTIFGQFLLPVILLLFCYSSVYLIVNRNLSMYCTTDSLKTTTLANLPSVRQTKRVNLSSLENSTDTAIIVSDRSPFHYRRILMHPIFYRLRRSSSGSLSNQSSAKIAQDKPRQFYVTNHFLSRARLKTIKLTFIVVLTYILCSTPFYIGSIIMALHGKFISQKTMSRSTAHDFLIIQTCSF